MSHVPRRVAHDLRDRLARILKRKISDPRLARVTITGVDLTSDLSSARVHYHSGDGSGDEEERCSQAFESARGYLRRELAASIKLRRVPELHFVWDASLERGARVEDVLREISEQRARAEEESS